MTTIRLYFKLLKNGLPVVIFYMVLFLFFVNINMGALVNKDTKNIRIGVINYDADSKISKDFIEYLNRYGNVFYLEDEEEAEENFFYNKADGIIIIPYQFGEEFSSGQDITVGLQAIRYSAHINYLINEYFNNVTSSVDFDTELEKSERNEILIKNIAPEEVSADKVSADTASISYTSYYNMAAYILLVCILYGVNLVMKTYRDRDIQRRILLSLSNENKVEQTLFIGNLSFTLLMAALFIVIDRIIHRDTPYTIIMFFLHLNFILYSLTALGLGYIIFVLVKRKEMKNILIHIMPVAMALFSGVFIPQTELRFVILRISSFTPMYWFVGGNALLSGMGQLDWDSIKGGLSSSITLLWFVAALFAIYGIISKYKNQIEYME